MSEQSSEVQRTIAQINAMVRSIVEVETLDHFYWIGGRVERYYKSNLGHIYFNLVDDRSQIRCMLHDSQTGKINFDIKNDIEIEVYGDVQVYEERAEIQLQVLDTRLIDAHGISTISGIQQLKQEGLYPIPPKTIPNPIRKVGIITSKSSRAVGDFETTYQIAGQTIVLAPVIWQFVMLEGERAVESIIDGIHKLNTNPDIDMVAIIRGGGRYINLAIFDDVDIARTIARSPKYIVTGIGHDRDSTLADQVADYVASTPTSVANYIAKLCLESQATPLTVTPANQQTSYVAVLFAVIGVMFVIIVILLIANFQ